MGLARGHREEQSHWPTLPNPRLGCPLTTPGHEAKLGFGWVGFSYVCFPSVWADILNLQTGLGQGRHLLMYQMRQSQGCDKQKSAPGE